MPPANPLLAGILLTIAAGGLFAAMDSVSKHLSTLMPVMQVIWGRYVVQTVVMTAWLCATTGTRFLRTAHPGLQLTRGLLLLVCTFLMYEALSRVPLADATAVLFFSPIMVTVLSVLLLKERIGPHRIGAVIAGFCGMMLILRPGVGSFHPALFLALGGAVLNAVYLLLTRRLAGREDSASTQFNTTAAGAIVMSVLVIPFWQTPNLSTALQLLALGLLGTLGHFLLVVAFSHASASLLSPFLYTQVLVAAGVSVVLFGDPLHPATVVGTAILVGSGLTIWWRENRTRARRPAVDPATRAEIHPGD